MTYLVLLQFLNAYSPSKRMWGDDVFALLWSLLSLQPPPAVSMLKSYSMVSRKALEVPLRYKHPGDLMVLGISWCPQSPVPSCSIVFGAVLCCDGHAAV